MQMCLRVATIVAVLGLGNIPMSYANLQQPDEQVNELIQTNATSTTDQVLLGGSDSAQAPATTTTSQSTLSQEPNLNDEEEMD